MLIGDGHLFTFCLNKSNFELSNMRKLALGTQPITLTTLHRFELTHVFAGCDRPSVIYGNSGKLVYSNVNMQDVTYMTTFHTVSNPYAIAFADRDNFFIGSIDEIQKLHVLTHPLENEFARRIAYQESTRSFGVVTMKTEIRHSWGLVESDWFKVLDDQTFESKLTFRDSFIDADSHTINFFSRRWWPFPNGRRRKSPIYLFHVL